MEKLKYLDNGDLYNLDIILEQRQTLISNRISKKEKKIEHLKAEIKMLEKERSEIATTYEKLIAEEDYQEGYSLPF